jgi:hypothetical protein
VFQQPVVDGSLVLHLIQRVVVVSTTLPSYRYCLRAAAERHQPPVRYAIVLDQLLCLSLDSHPLIGSLAHSLTLTDTPLTHSLTLTLSLSLCLPLSPPVACFVSLSLCLSLSRCLSTSLSIFIYPSISTRCPQEIAARLSAVGQALRERHARGAGH